MMVSVLVFFDKAGSGRDNAILLPAREAFVIGKLKKTTTECDRDETETSTIKKSGC